jgi:sec-independent protein translocase protein TatA
VLNVGPAELMVILVVALLVLGPKKLPEAARQMGRAISEFRRVTAGLQDEVRGVLDEHMVSDPLPPLVMEPTILPPSDPTALVEDPGAPAVNGETAVNGESAPPSIPPTPPPG